MQCECKEENLQGRSSPPHLLSLALNPVCGAVGNNKDGAGAPVPCAIETPPAGYGLAMLASST